MNLKGKSFLKLLDLTPEEISGLLELAAVSFGFAVSTFSGQNLGAGKRNGSW